MKFQNWYEKIRGYRDYFIEYYVQQFGEDIRKTIEERFDSMKICFYIDPNYISCWHKLQLEEDYQTATYQFLNEYASILDIDMSQVSLEFSETLEHTCLKCKDRKTEKRIHTIFKIGSIGSSLMNDEYDFYDLYSFRTIEEFMTGEGKDYDNSEEELLHRRLMFLADMGEITIEGRPIDYFKSEECRSFVNSPRYKELENKYQTIAASAFKLKKEKEQKYQDLVDFMEKCFSVEERIIQKYDAKKENESDPDKRKEVEKECNREIAALRIIGGNFDLSDCIDEEAAIDHIVDSGDTQNTLTVNGDDNRQETIIFFCPFKSVPGYEDVDLRHEIRHTLTTHVTVEGNTTTYKVGNKIDRFVDDECVGCELIDYNEWITQIEARKETKDAYSKGIYIISKPSTKNRDAMGRTCDYDLYTPLFEIIYNALPESAKKSQIELSNDSLYEIVSLEQLTEIEDMIRNGHRYDEKLIDKLQEIANKLARTGLTEVPAQK